MKRIFQLCFTMAFFSLGFSQSLKPIAEKVQKSHTSNRLFVKYNLFTVEESVQKQRAYEAAAEGVTVMKLNTNEIQRINTERPEALEMDFPFEGRTITVELVKNNFLTNDFKVNTDKGYALYAPGVYYQGIVKGDDKSIVAISFSNDDVVGVTSIEDVGNIVIGKTSDSQNFVSYNDYKLKKSNPFTCGAEDLLQNQGIETPTYHPSMLNSKMTENCVRIYYEAAYNIYTAKGSSISQTTDWVLAMHNNISTLFANDGITVALSEVFVWTTQDPYNGTTTGTKLNQFIAGRQVFNGDVGQLIKNRTPVNGGIAVLNSLCTSNKHSYVDVNLNYSNVPTFSWNIEAMTHETGHSLGSPHTHACAWNGDNTAIDGCGPASGNGEGCDAPLPTGGGTIMSYCHLVGSVGINFTNGFGPQPAALIRNTVNSKACLGTDCVTSCTVTVAGLSVSNVTQTTATATINDNTGTAWKYKLAKMDGTVVEAGSSSTKVLNLTNLVPGTYYTIGVGNDCSGPNALSRQQLILTDADWCSGIQFTDPGGPDANYGDSQSIIKTFYPANSSDKVKMTFNQFDLQASDYINVFNGPTTSATRFPHGTQITGTTIPAPFESTHATGAITVRFISNATDVSAGWKATVECLTLSTNEKDLGANINISKTSQNGVFAITSKDKITAYSVFDTSGKLVINTYNLNSSNESLDLSKYPTGAYLVSITTSKETVTKKIIR